MSKFLKFMNRNSLLLLKPSDLGKKLSPNIQTKPKPMKSNNQTQPVLDHSMEQNDVRADGQQDDSFGRWSPASQLFLALMYVCLWLAALIVITPGIAAPMAAKLLPIIHGTGVSIHGAATAPGWLVTLVAYILATQVVAITAACASADIRIGPFSDEDQTDGNKQGLMKRIEANCRPTFLWIVLLVVTCFTLYQHDQARASILQLPGTELNISEPRHILVHLLPAPSALPYALLAFLATTTLLIHFVLAPRKQNTTSVTQDSSHVTQSSAKDVSIMGDS